MDTQTVAAYDTLAETFAQEWREQPVPEDMYALFRREFKAGGATADIGCGAGREVAWLNANGYPAVGYDASAGLLEAARSQYPGLSFRRAPLPELVGIADGAFDNVVCETVIMHLPPEQIGAAVRRLVSLLRPGGTLYLSWRVTPDADQRDGRGRLFTAFEAAPVYEALAGTDMVFNEAAVSRSSGRTIHRIVARKV
ncbi:class I SAM-dependent methyltransferase [Ralstonia sp. 24A2]|uniref:class I SAM-dependent methyltransferase n=1 Tax=Ralstonia sp. 24A2 TaxID=3447364 RepID=UPI003F6A44BA